MCTCIYCVSDKRNTLYMYVDVYMETGHSSRSKKQARGCRKPGSVRLSHTLPGTQYTHYNLKHMLPQHCTTYNDVYLLITSTKV